MHVRRYLKTKLRKALNGLGYEIRALNRLGAPDAVVYNTAEYADRFYADPILVEKYRRESVAQHLQNLRILLAEEGIHIQKEMAVLDASCGTGDCLKMLREEYGCRHLSGTDISRVALAITMETCPQAELHELDLLKEKLSGDFDIIFCQQVLEHLVEPETALRNLISMLRPNGVLVITVPDGRLDDFAGHIHFWGTDSLPIFLRKELPGYIIRTGHLQDGVSLFAVITGG
jgi:2-polyprenyl-3-methyl-5-hydroxy-6-metoxy-1,4-benzoquinol methylase